MNAVAMFVVPPSGGMIRGQVERAARLLGAAKSISDAIGWSVLADHDHPVHPIE